MEPGCPSGGGGYPLSGAPGGGGRSGGREGGGYRAGRRGGVGGGLSRSPALAVPASGRIPAVGGTAAWEGDGRPRAPEAGPGLGLFERVCSYRKKDRVKNSLPRAAFNINEDLLSYRKKQIMFLITKRLKY